MQMPGRVFGSGSYRYGFNGKENDNEVNGAGNQQDYGMRIYDPRLGRFLSVDPISQLYPWFSPYHFAGNTPVWAIDLDGLEPYANAYKFVHESNPKINLFHSDNVINMSGSTRPTSWNSLGWQRDVKYFWNNYQNTPLGQEALSKSNLKLISKGRSPIVDEQWNSVMKQFGNDGVLDEPIHHHHHNKGANAVPLPKSKHIGGENNKINHGMNNREGPSVRQTSGRYLNKTYSFFSFLTMFNTSPNGMIHTFHTMGTEDENRAYPVSLGEQLKGAEFPGQYYEWKWLGKPGESLREFRFFTDYEKRDGTWRGKDQVGEPIQVDIKGNETKIL
jgi:RHS repeat-associated protein